MTLEQYLKDNVSRGLTEFRLVARIGGTVSGDGLVSFYIHPMNTDGDTPIFAVKGNQLSTVTNES